MRRILFITMFLLFLCVSSIGMAFDNHRQGFIIGGLGGIAVNYWKADTTDGTSIAGHIDFRIGGGLKGDKFMLYFWSAGNYFNIENYREPEEDVVILYGIGGFGVSYYFKPTSPSLYINAGIGTSMWADPFTRGLGVMGGIGYEFARHWSLECGVMGSIMQDTFGGRGVNGPYYNSFALTLSIIYIAY